MANLCRNVIATTCLLVVSATANSQLVDLPSDPVGNPLTEQKRLLGKILFWEEQLSSDNSVACGSCHIPAAGGADPRQSANPGPDGAFLTSDDTVGSPGMVRLDSTGRPVEDPTFGFDRQVTKRGSPSIFMSGYAEHLFWDGRARSAFIDPLNPGETLIANGAALESQSVVPIVSTVEMAKDGRTWNDVTSKLANSTPMALASRLPPDVAQVLSLVNSYGELFSAAFGDESITPSRIAMALAAYQRTLVPNQTPWDLYMTGDATAMTASQIEGWTDFSTQTLCVNCHVAPQFTDHQFYNIGLRPATDDMGLQAITMLAEDFGRFKTPSLRNVGLRKSLMHVGWIVDVVDATDFYNAEASDFRHTQFKEHQTDIPTADPGVTEPYADMELFAEDLKRRTNVVDFLSNGLTDPRAALEVFPFDRPLLGSEVIRAMTYNVQASEWSTERADSIAIVILDQAPDVIALQGSPKMQLSELFTRLSDQYTVEKFGSDDNSAPILFRRNKFTVRATGSVDLGDACPGENFSNYLRLQIVGSSEMLMIYNNYLCGSSNATDNERQVAALIDDVIDARNRWHDPTLIMGGINATATSSSLRFMLESEPIASGAVNPIKITDSWSEALPGKFRDDKGNWLLVTVDGLLIFDVAQVSNAETLAASDHEPLLVSIGVDTTPMPNEGPLDNDAPSTPASITLASATSSSLEINWAASSDNVAVAAYRVYRDGERLQTVADGPFKDSGLQPATEYQYQVTALDGRGNESEKSPVEALSTDTVRPPPAPQTGGGGGAISPWPMLWLWIFGSGVLLRRKVRAGKGKRSS